MIYAWEYSPAEDKSYGLLPIRSIREGLPISVRLVQLHNAEMTIGRNLLGIAFIVDEPTDSPFVKDIQIRINSRLGHLHNAIRD